MPLFSVVRFGAVCKRKHTVFNGCTRNNGDVGNILMAMLETFSAPEPVHSSPVCPLRTLELVLCSTVCSTSRPATESAVSQNYCVPPPCVVLFRSGPQRRDDGRQETAAPGWPRDCGRGKSFHRQVQARASKTETLDSQEFHFACFSSLPAWRFPSAVFRVHSINSTVRAVFCFVLSFILSQFCVCVNVPVFLRCNNAPGPVGSKRAIIANWFKAR